MSINLVIFHPYAQKPPADGYAPNLAQPYGVADVITCDKFFGDRFRDVDSVEGRKLPFPIDKASGR